eukprot:TRINITY_DN5991_c0_g4_i3.p1 TRINITY_DN5991_c0_g4~~TRINITY_DN5991_c0_g4_i3.p1  ORF type:complete len:278 (+),score=48.88 TRINITY_DN5991_c0_g4_i3:186-1019(+)
MHLQTKPPRIELFNFLDRTSVEKWKVVTDSIVGGSSVATFTYDSETPLERTQEEIQLLKEMRELESRLIMSRQSIFSFAELKSHFQPQEEIQAVQEQKETLAVQEQSYDVGSAKFVGNISYTLPTDPFYKEVERVGFACLRSPVYGSPGLDLSAYKALDFRIRTDGKLYVAQIKTYYGMEEDLYQAILPPTPPGKWTRVLIPLDNFVLTFKGYTEDFQSPLDKDVIHHISFLMAERDIPGPFGMHIDWIHATQAGGTLHQSRYTVAGQIVSFPSRKH